MLRISHPPREKPRLAAGRTLAGPLSHTQLLDGSEGTSAAQQRDFTCHTWGLRRTRVAGRAAPARGAGGEPGHSRGVPTVHPRGPRRPLVQGPSWEGTGPARKHPGGPGALRSAGRREEGTLKRAVGRPKEYIKWLVGFIPALGYTLARSRVLWQFDRIRSPVGKKQLMLWRLKRWEKITLYKTAELPLAKPAVLMEYFPVFTGKYHLCTFVLLDSSDFLLAWQPKFIFVYSCFMRCLFQHYITF